MVCTDDDDDDTEDVYDVDDGNVDDGDDDGEIPDDEVANIGDGVPVPELCSSFFPRDWTETYWCWWLITIGYGESWDFYTFIFLPPYKTNLPRYFLLFCHCLGRCGGGHMSLGSRAVSNTPFASEGSKDSLISRSHDP